MAAMDAILGSTLNGVLFGALLVQYYIYWMTGWHRDATGIKVVVIILLVADILNFILDLVFAWLFGVSNSFPVLMDRTRCTAHSYSYLVTHFGDFEYIQVSGWLMNTEPGITAIIASTVQCFFAWRVKVLTGNRWLWALLNVASFASFLCGLGTSIACFIVHEFAQFHRFKAIAIVWLTLSAITDILIAGVLVYQLSRRRNGIADTEDLISKLIRFTIQTGLVTSVCAITNLVVYLALLYTGACLSSLNARTQWVTTTEHSGGAQFASAPRSGAIPAGINVVTTSIVHHDPGEFELEEPYRRGRKSKLGSSVPRRSGRGQVTSFGVPSIPEIPQKVIALADDDASMYDKPPADIEAGQPLDMTPHTVISNDSPFSSENGTTVIMRDESV
ncbi:hypothetical protein DL93DRAFT_2083634 [Clavulina sp. PMI_390]|nr:hypothetical protein DL93DRAFT_2083634 [Clavulina sp. PMI_390]